MAKITEILSDDIKKEITELIITTVEKNLPKIMANAESNKEYSLEDDIRDWFDKQQMDLEYEIEIVEDRILWVKTGHKYKCCKEIRFDLDTMNPSLTGYRHILHNDLKRLVTEHVDGMPICWKNKDGA